MDKNGHIIMAGDGVYINKGWFRGVYPYIVRNITGDTFTDTTKSKSRQCNQYTFDYTPRQRHTASAAPAPVPRTTTRQLEPHNLEPHNLTQSVRHITSLLQPILTFSKDMSSKERTRERTQIIVKMEDKINGDSNKFEINKEELVKLYYKEMGSQTKDLFNEIYYRVLHNGGGIKNKKRKNKSNYKNTKRKNTKRRNTKRKNTKRKNTKRRNTKRKNTKRKNTKRKKKSNYKISF